MTTTASDGPAASGASTGTAADSGRRGRTVLLGVLVGVVVFVATAAGSFALDGGFTASRVGRTIDCGEFQQCIPGLRVDDVTGVLEGEGHECRRDPGRVACTLEIGFTVYDTALHSAEDDGHVTEASARVSRPDDTQAFGFPRDAPPPSGALPYFSWIATLPYADDQTAASEITTWLERQIDRGDDATIQFGDYRYEMIVERPGVVTLSLRAQRPFES